ncbi:MAG: hypothetical protein IJ088_01310 [Clostridia bacterium]|nr:hypothetical protein [Clostridia bacterium]
MPKETEGKRNRSKLGENTCEIEQLSDESAHNQSESEIIALQREQIEKLTAENERLREIISRIHDFSHLE